MVNKIKNMQEIVERFLIKVPRTKDDDNYLVSRIWYEHLSSNGIDMDSLTAKEFFKIYSADYLPCADTITRARRKCQEENPSLRGESWEQRHKESIKVKTNINK